MYDHSVPSCPKLGNLDSDWAQGTPSPIRAAPGERASAHSGGRQRFGRAAPGEWHQAIPGTTSAK